MLGEVVIMRGEIERMSDEEKKRDHYTVGDALVVLFSSPIFYFTLMIWAVASMMRSIA